MVCTSSAREGRPRAVDFVRHDSRRLYTVGRLDADSRGLIVLTNDGALTQRLTHPRHHVAKTYRVRVRGSVRGATLVVVGYDGSRMAALDACKGLAFACPVHAGTKFANKPPLDSTRGRYCTRTACESQWRPPLLAGRIADK